MVFFPRQFGFIITTWSPCELLNGNLRVSWCLLLLLYPWVQGHLASRTSQTLPDQSWGRTASLNLLLPQVVVRKPSIQASWIRHLGLCLDLPPVFMAPLCVSFGNRQHRGRRVLASSRSPYLLRWTSAFSVAHTVASKLEIGQDVLLSVDALLFEYIHTSYITFISPQIYKGSCIANFSEKEKTKKKIYK